MQLLDSGSRDEVRQLCELDSFLNVVIPRGGKGLIRAVTEYARVPVLKHLDGVCHVYVDAAADLKMAVNVLDDAKTQRPGVCNAAETPAGGRRRGGTVPADGGGAHAPACRGMPRV